MPRPACRLFILTARERPFALILRRGPSAWYHLIAWHTDTDRFEHGAWFRGRIYEERCDLSPDGELFLYFALQGRKFSTSYGGAWTAVSRSPWLHALTLWPHGSTWGGGGRFVGRRKVVLRGSGKPHPDHPLIGLEVANGPAPAHEVPGADWCGRDFAGHLIFTRGARIFRRMGTQDIELADLGGLSPDPQPAPDRATKPLRPLPSARRKK